MNSRSVVVPAERLSRWIDGFRERHGGTAAWQADALVLKGDDEAHATLHPLFAGTPDGDAVTWLIRHAAHPPRCAVLLIRRGGFAAAVVDGGKVLAGRAGKRRVQGRTTAGGWSQQRFARRREKQADELVGAAIDYAIDVVLPHLPVNCLVTGGDRPLLDAALAEPRLRPLADLPAGPHLAIGNPDRSMIAELPRLLTDVRIEVNDPTTPDR